MELGCPRASGPSPAWKTSGARARALVTSCQRCQGSTGQALWMEGRARAPRTPPRAPPRLHPTPRALSAHPPPLGPVPTAPYLLGGLRAPEAEVGTLGVGGLVPLSPYPGPQGPPACSGNGTKAGGTPNPHCLREQGKEEPPRCPGPSRWYVSQPGCPLPSQAPALFPRLAASTAL